MSDSIWDYEFVEPMQEVLDEIAKSMTLKTLERILDLFEIERPNQFRRWEDVLRFLISIFLLRRASSSGNVFWRWSCLV